jgi:beta-galactosidase
MPFSDRHNHLTVLHQFYDALYHLNAGVDFVFPRSTSLGEYKVLLVPPLYVADDELLQRISDYVRSGGHVLMSLKSGFANEYSTVRWTMAPGPLREAAGFRYQEFSSLKEPLPLSGDPYGAGPENRVSTWAEFLIPETATVLASYDHPFYGRFPALTRNRHGKGTLTYQGTILSDALQTKVIGELLKLAGLSGPDQALPRPVRVKHGVTAAGRKVHFYLNYSPDGQSFRYAHGAGVDLLSGRAMGASAELSLPAWDLAIIEEGADGK